MPEIIELPTLQPTHHRSSTSLEFDSTSIIAPSVSVQTSQQHLDDISSFSPDQEVQLNPVDILPPVDGGRRAWLFLIAATAIEILVWGLPFSIGILHNYWTNTLFKGQGESTITLAATLQTGFLYMSAGLFGPLLTALPRWQKTIQVLGLVAASVSMITSAFATKPWHLIVTIGCFYPLSGALYLPCATLLFEWFQGRRGMATGIMYAGTGIGGTLFPFIMSGLLEKVGYKAAMISIGVGYLILGSIALIPIRRRIPLSRYEQQGGAGSEGIRRRPKIDWSFMRRSAMLMGSLTILLTSLGNFIPSLWLPTYADELHLTRPSGTGLIALMNAASVPGNALLGYLSDQLPLHIVVVVSCVGSAAACAFLWGFGVHEAQLVAFVIVFGVLGLSFSALWSKIISIISRDDPVAPTLIFSMFTFIRGVGNISSGPVSDALLKLNTLKGSTGGYGFHNYGVLLVYTAVTILSGGAAGIMLRGR
nr:uncharacterized protein CI109_000982 [Kwoniella shandongensis]KAA5530802.1 hypothetical protein CI109_000982 [Kwoniella shandongensis]